MMGQAHTSKRSQLSVWENVFNVENVDASVVMWISVLWVIIKNGFDVVSDWRFMEELLFLTDVIDAVDIAFDVVLKYECN